MEVLKDISKRRVVFIMSSQILTITVSLIMTIGVTKVLGIAEYGYWQLFLLYISYVGFFHLGLIDGVYLRYGGKHKSELDLFEVRSIFWSLSIIQLFILLLFFFLARNLTLLNQELLIPTFATAYITNTQSFMHFVLLSTNNITKYSVSVIIEKAFVILAILFCYIYYNLDYQVLILIYISSKILSIIILLFFFGFLFNKSITFPIDLLFLVIKSGVILMLANIINGLILGIPRFFIERKWGIEIFGKVSLAFTTVFFFSVLFYQLSHILFPVLRNKDFLQQKTTFIKLRSNISRVLMIFFIAYFPLSIFFSLILPKYEYSFVIFIYLLPIVIFDGLNQILFLSYIKTLNLQKNLLRINLIVVLCLLTLLFLSYYYDANITVFLLSAVFSIALRCFLCERLLSSLYQVNTIRSFIFEVAFSFVFIALFTSGIKLIYVLSVSLIAVWIHYKFSKHILFINPYEK